MIYLPFWNCIFFGIFWLFLFCHRDDVGIKCSTFENKLTGEFRSHTAFIFKMVTSHTHTQILSWKFYKRWNEFIRTTRMVKYFAHRPILLPIYFAESPTTKSKISIWLKCIAEFVKMYNSFYQKDLWRSDLNINYLQSTQNDHEKKLSIFTFINDFL